MTIRSIQWDADAWDEYCDWQQTNKNIVKRINQLVRDIRRMPFDGIGKPSFKGEFKRILEPPN